MSGPVGALKLLTQISWAGFAQLLTGWIDLCGARCEQHVRPGVGQQACVYTYSAWVIIKIVLLTKLQWVHEDRNNCEVAVLLSPAQKRKMTIMQGAHGWDEADSLAGLVRLGKGCC